MLNSEKKTNEQRLIELESKVDFLLKLLSITKFNEKEESSGLTQVSNSVAVEAKKPVANISKQEASGINLLPILALICFVFAAVFIVKLAMESGWLTPVRQWGLLTIFGFTLTLFGLFFERIEKSYRSYACAAGIIVLYISAYSSFLYFNIFTIITALGFASLISLLCFYLVKFYDSELFTVLSIVGTYISPLLLGQRFDFLFTSGFFLIWSYVFSQAAVYLKSRSLTLLAAYLGIGIFAALNINEKDSYVLLNVMLVESMQFIIFAGGVYYYSIKNNNALSNAEAIAYMPLLMFFYGVIYFLLFQYNRDLAPWVSLGFAAFLYFLYWRASQSIKNLESQTLVKSFLTVVLFHSGYMELMPAQAKPWLLPIALLALYISEQKKDFKNVSIYLKFLFGAISLIEFSSLCFQLISQASLVSALPSLAIIIIGFIYYSKSAKLIKDREMLFLSLLHLLTILTIYRLAFDYGSLAVSAGWALYSVIVLGLGYIKRNEVTAKSSLIILAVTCLKAFFYDASQTSSLVRISSLVLTGIILYGAGYLFQKINKWEKVTK